MRKEQEVVAVDDRNVEEEDQDPREVLPPVLGEGKAELTHRLALSLTHPSHLGPVSLINLSCLLQQPLLRFLILVLRKSHRLWPRYNHYNLNR